MLFCIADFVLEQTKSKSADKPERRAAGPKSPNIGKEKGNLTHPRALDAQMASIDDEIDPSVNAVDGGSGPASPRGSASPTPPAESRSPVAASTGNLDDRPGLEDGDTLIESTEKGCDAKLNTGAVAVARPRQKQKAYQKKQQARADTDSDTDMPSVPEPRKGRESVGASKGERQVGAGKGNLKRPITDVDLVSDDDIKPQKEGSRHTRVAVSQIYKDWQGSLLDDVRRRFQTLMFARDGYPLMMLASHKKINYKLALRAAQAIMPAKVYASFHGQMDRAYRDTDKS